LGLVTSFLIGANYQTSGNYSSEGYYPNYLPNNNYDDPNDPNDDWIDVTIPIENRTAIDEQNDMEAKAVHLALTTSVGITYPLDYFTTVFCGPELVWGINSILKNADYTDTFGNVAPAEKAGLSKLGIKFGISYKF
jgi:hypothetical protein